MSEGWSPVGIHVYEFLEFSMYQAHIKNNLGKRRLLKQGKNTTDKGL